MLPIPEVGQSKIKDLLLVVGPSSDEMGGTQVIMTGQMNGFGGDPATVGLVPQQLDGKTTRCSLAALGEQRVESFKLSRDYTFYEEGFED